MIEEVTKQLAHVWDTSPTAYVGFLAFIVAGLTLRSNAKTAKIKHSIDFETTYKHTTSIKEASDHVLKLITHSSNELCRERMFDVSSNEDRIKTDSDYVYINDFLNEWERCANGVFHKVYNEKFLYGTYATTVIGSFHKTLPFILVRQDKRERVYIKLCWLALRWHIRKLKETGQPVSYLLTESLRLLSLHHKIVYGNKLRYFHLYLYQLCFSRLFGIPETNKLLKASRQYLTLYLVDISNKGK